MADDVTVAERILHAAADAGATTAFGLPGVHNLAFWGSAAGERIVVVRHEQTAVYAADGLARASGGAGLALTTTGPGAANAVAAFGEAAACGSPVVLVASEVPGRGTLPDEGRGLLYESRDRRGGASGRILWTRMRSRSSPRSTVRCPTRCRSSAT